MVNAILFKSENQSWQTPKELFDKLNKEFNFDIDAAADSTNSLCSKWFGKDGVLENALEGSWKDHGKSFFLNPPYNAKLQDKFITKIIEEAKKECTIVCLLPVRTDTKRWDNIFNCASEIRFIARRLKFSNSKNSATFPSAVVIFSPDQDNLKVCRF